MVFYPNEREVSSKLQVCFTNVITTLGCLKSMIILELRMVVDPDAG